MAKRKKSKRERLLTDLNTKPASQWEYPKIGVFIPVGPTMDTIAADGFYDFARVHGLPRLKMGRTCQLDMARTRACEALVKQDELTHLLMLDSDHIHPPDIVPRLARWVVHDRNIEVVAALNISRAPVEQQEACCFFETHPGSWNGDDNKGLGRRYDFGEEELTECAIAGTGAMMIAKTALEKLDRPFFYFPTGDGWRDPKAEIAWPGEDIGFAANCRKNGIKQYIDTSANSPHLVTRLATLDEFRQFKGSSGPV